MSEYGSQYNSLQGFSYSITALINALSQLNSSLSSIPLPLETASFHDYDNSFKLLNTTGYAYTYMLSQGNCKKCIGFVLKALDSNKFNVWINDLIPLKPGAIFVLTTEQNRIFDMRTVTVTIEHGDQVNYMPICVN